VLKACGNQNQYHERTRKMMNLLKRLHKEEAGQDLIEYALIGLIIALGALAGMGKLASSINQEFTKIAGSLT
jgi:Flp pilus assembly pilin Flp